MAEKLSATDAGLSWALTIATYNRPDMVIDCIRLAVAQTRRPAEIVVVDGSKDWATTRDRVEAEIAVDYPELRWEYVLADELGSAYQRNQAVSIASSDVVFLIDDDSLMFPDCAAKIMELYDADEAGQVAGVSAMAVPQDPRKADGDERESDVAPGAAKKFGPVARLVRRILRADDIFVPYDADFPAHPMPGWSDQYRVGTRQLLVGHSMTMRRALAVKEPFDNVLKYYAAGEDSDQSYRASRHGLLLTALDARLHHAQSTGGRRSQFLVRAMGAMNPVIMHRLWATDQRASHRRLRRMWWRRLFIRIASDLVKRDFRFESSRGWFFGMRQMSRIFAMTSDEVREWYPKFQKSLLDQHG